ncbi:MAG: hypothetical protein QXU32_03220 [Nitrososphaerales archaeon]
MTIKKQWYLAGIAAAALALTVGIVQAQSLSPNVDLRTATATSPTDDKPLTFRATPDDFVNSGGRSAIIIKADRNEIEVSRGSTIKVTFQITHIAGTNPFTSVTVIANGIQGKLLPPSVLATTTVEERTNAIKEGIDIPGAIDLSPLVRFVPNAVTLAPRETKSIDMYITIPQNWSDEMVNKAANFSPSFTSPERGSPYDVGIFGDSVRVKVVG